MDHTPFRLGYFSRFGPTAWSAADDRTYGGDWWTGEHHIALARRLEASRGFEFLFFDDTSTVFNAPGVIMDAGKIGRASLRERVYERMWITEAGGDTQNKK